MKKIKRGLCCLLLVAMLANLCCFTALAGVDGQEDWGDQGNGTFVNPILNADYSDPDIIRVGEKYYMIYPVRCSQQAESHVAVVV